MDKNKMKLLVIVLTILFVVLGSYSLLHSDPQKDLEKAMREMDVATTDSAILKAEEKIEKAIKRGAKDNFIGEWVPDKTPPKAF